MSPATSPVSLRSRRGFLARAIGTSVLAAAAHPAAVAGEAEPLTVGLIGCGPQGRSFARAMAQVPG
ncbi:MAG: hypothetical protein ACKO40_10270, partial [Planctomycetaceae bacterium]